MAAEEVNFRKFLEENGVDTELFKKDLLEGKLNKDLEYYFKTVPVYCWIGGAFAWSFCSQPKVNFYQLDLLWVTECEDSSNITHGFTKYSIKDLYVQ